MVRPPDVPVGDVARRVYKLSPCRRVHAPHDGAGVQAERSDPPAAARAYLDLIAFRSAEPTDVRRTQRPPIST